MGALHTRQRQLLTPSLLSKRDGEGSLTAICLLVTPCLKTHILLYCVDRGYFIHHYEAHKDIISLDEYAVDDKRTVSMDEVKDLLKIFLKHKVHLVASQSARQVVSFLNLGDSMQVDAQNRSGHHDGLR